MKTGTGSPRQQAGGIEVLDRGSDRPLMAEAKDAFLLKVAGDPNAGEAALKIAIWLALRFASRSEYEKTGRLVAWPSTRSLSAKTGLFRSRVDRGVRCLEDCGHIRVERPEKRGATHHNRYVLNFEIGRTDAANSEGAIGRTSVANSDAPIGRTDAANSEGQIGRTDAAALAAPVGPNLLEKPHEGAGALGARRAPVQEEEVVSIGEEDEDRREDGGAFDRAPLTRTGSSAAVDPFDPDGWRSDPDFIVSAAAQREADKLGAECAPEGAPAPIHPAADLPDEDEDEVEVVNAANPQPAIDQLALILEPVYDTVATDAPHKLRLEELVALWVRGFVTGIPSARIAVTSDTAAVITKLKRLARTDTADDFISVAEFAQDHMAAITRIARKATADAISAARAVEAYEAQVGSRVARAMKREAVNG